MLKKFFKALLPPLIPQTAKRDMHSKQRPRLFDGDEDLFLKVIEDSKVYAEYGSGTSTVWVARNTSAEIYSVDSSSEWIEKVRQQLGSRDGVRLHLADLGPVGAWGRPLSYQKAKNFGDYTDWIWSNKPKPDLVLIDGRFRVCCFLTSLINGEPGTKIIFDDYVRRPAYHFVEKYVKPAETFGRQALFVIPEKEKLSVAEARESINHFRFVFD